MGRARLSRAEQRESRREGNRAEQRAAEVGWGGQPLGKLLKNCQICMDRYAQSLLPRSTEDQAFLRTSSLQPAQRWGASPAQPKPQPPQALPDNTRITPILFDIYVLRET